MTDIIKEEGEIYISPSEQEKLLEELEVLKSKLEQTYPKIPKETLENIFKECQELILYSNRSEAYLRHSLHAEFHNLERRILTLQNQNDETSRQEISLELLDYAKLSLESILNAPGFITMGGVLSLYLVSLDKLYITSPNPQISTFTPLSCLVLFLIIFEALLAKDLADDFKNRVQKRRNEISKKLMAEG